MIRFPWRAALVALGCALATACTSGPAGPRISAVVPSEIGNDAPAEIAIEGRNFLGEASGSLEGTAQVDNGWTVRVGPRSFSTPDVVWVGPDELRVVVPAGLEPGVQDVTVVSPGGRHDTLRGGLRVLATERRTLLSIEDAPGGSGAPIGALTLVVGNSLTLYAVLRIDDDGSYAGSVPAHWSLAGDIGVLESSGASASAVFEPLLAGSGRIEARHGNHFASTGDLTVLAGPATELRVESAPDGGGVEIGDTTRTTDDVVTVHAVLRDALGNFAGTADDAIWTLTSPVGVPGPAGPTGVIDFVSPGSTRIVASTDGLPPATTGVFTVLPGRAAALAITPATANLAVGGSALAFSASAVDADGNATGDVGALTWSVSSGTIAEIDPVTGVFTPLAGGTGTVRVESSHGPAAESGPIAVASEGGLAPRACFTTNATEGAAAVTSFTFDASCSTDAEDAPGALQVRWDLDGDGAFDTSWSTTRTVSRVYGSTGAVTVWLQVRDSSGWTDLAPHLVYVHAGNAVVVTTAVDELDAGATPALPQGTGLSLREAILHVNALGSGRTITFQSAMTIVHGSPLPDLVPGGAAVVGRPGVVLEMSGTATTSCLGLAGADQLALWLEIRNCGGAALDLEGVRARVAETIVRDAGGNGIQLKADATRAGPGNEVLGVRGKAVAAKAASCVVDGNWIHDNDGDGVSANGSGGTVIRGNRIADNGGVGIDLSSSQNGTLVQHNVIVRNALSGIEVCGNCKNADIRNNVLAGNGEWGVDGAPASISSIDHNAFWSNGFGAWSGGSPPAAVLANPLFEDPSGPAFRLRPESPCVDAGVDLGLDRNAADAGLFFGGAPDLGAREMPY